MVSKLQIMHIRFVTDGFPICTSRQIVHSKLELFLQPLEENEVIIACFDLPNFFFLGTILFYNVTYAIFSIRENDIIL